MTKNTKEVESDKISMGISVCIALCVVAIFCLISIIVIENVQTPAEINKTKHVKLPNNKDFTYFGI